MTARVLVVDDILANVKLLEARLSAEYFEVITANNGQDALDICNSEQADVVLLDVMMPGMDGYEVCKKLKQNPKTQHIPVIMVTALDQPSEKIKGLEVGADDFLTKPVDDLALITRVKNLARLKTLTDEMMMRASTSEDMGVSSYETSQILSADMKGQILCVEDSKHSIKLIESNLKIEHDVEFEGDIQLALPKLTEKVYDLLIVSLNLETSDGLRLCSQVRSMDKIRRLPILTIVDNGENARLLRGLEMGVNDYLLRPIEKNELKARVRTQIRRKCFSDYLSNKIEESVEMAITDALTGLHNRHYMERHMSALVNEANEKGKPLSVLVSDIDYFKSINDTYGHDIGDKVLQEFSSRFRKNSRGIDLVCRYGGEEFVVIMPDTDLSKALSIGERLRRSISEKSFQIDNEKYLDLTISTGIASLDQENTSAETLLKKADQALYRAKKDGRNRVVTDAA